MLIKIQKRDNSWMLLCRQTQKRCCPTFVDLNTHPISEFGTIHFIKERTFSNVSYPQGDYVVYVVHMMHLLIHLFTHAHHMCVKRAHLGCIKCTNHKITSFHQNFCIP